MPLLRAGHTLPPADGAARALSWLAASGAGNGAVQRLLRVEAQQSPPVEARPLGPSLRAGMEARLGADLSTVRLHTGAAAAASAEALGARAYTVGQDIVLGPGEYRPAETAGRELLAHELAHTVQQAHGGTTPAGSWASERAAATAARLPTGHGPPATVVHTAVGLARQAKSGGDPTGRDPALLSGPELEAEYQSALRAAKDTTVAEAERAAAGRYAGQLRTAMDSRAGVSAQPPTPEELVSHVAAQRAFSSAAPRRDSGANLPPDFDPAGVGRPLGPGWQTNGAVVVRDGRGNQIGAELGQFQSKGDPHAEGRAASALLRRLSEGCASGGEVVVAVDQVPCPECQAELLTLTRHVGARSVAAYGAVRAAMNRPGDVTPKTATRGMYQGQAAGGRERPPTRTELLWGETAAPQPSGAGGTSTGPPPSSGTSTSGGGTAPEAAPASESVPQGGRPAAQEVSPVEPPPPTAEPTAPPVEPAAGPEPAAGLSRAGAAAGTAGGLLSVGAPLLYSWYLHPRAVEARREQEGYVPTGPTQFAEEGLLKRFGRQLLDPFLESSADPSSRLNVPTWRQKVREAAAAKGPGQTLEVNWQVQVPNPVFGTEMRDFRVIYSKQPDGSWRTGPPPRDMPVAPPDINRIIDPAVSDDSVRSMLAQETGASEA
ncbi:DUF4157 domain-containing protein [Streptomyces sp. NPDC005355]|uniref:eCIS core domain-containing protein n=1 Tax=Streptomyces sp. NPDC005355 TaxID=3157038 RepID=UPI00339F36E2